MKLSVRIADPAGNITLFVMNPIPPEQYASVASKLLGIKEFRAEQVAFQVPPQMGADGRIQMMGGEFCGNATRSYGYLLSTLLPGTPRHVQVEVSGAGQPLEVSIDQAKGTCEVEMPLLINTIKIPFQGEQFDAVCFDGIVHTVIPGVPRSQEFVEELLSVIQSKVESSAYGILFTEGDHMTPVIYVCETDSLIWESSCGSGSIAVASLRALQQGQGEYRCSLQQPGGIIEAVAVVKNDRVVKCSMGGPIKLSQELELELPE